MHNYIILKTICSLTNFFFERINDPKLEKMKQIFHFDFDFGDFDLVILSFLIFFSKIVSPPPPPLFGCFYKLMNIIYKSMKIYLPFEFIGDLTQKNLHKHFFGGKTLILIFAVYSFRKQLHHTHNTIFKIFRISSKPNIFFSPLLIFKIKK